MTRVIVRLMVNDDERQSRAAERFIREHGGSGDPCYVSDVTLIETVWVLETVYGVFTRTSVKIYRNGAWVQTTASLGR